MKKSSMGILSKTEQNKDDKENRAGFKFEIEVLLHNHILQGSKSKLKDPGKQPHIPIP